MKYILSLCLLAAFLAFGCDDSDTATPNPVAATFTGNIDGANTNIDILDVVASPTSTGVQIIMSDTEGGAADTAVAEGERQFKVKIVNIDQIAIGTADSVGLTGNVTVVFDDETTHMLGTSGTMTVTAVGAEVDDSIAFTFAVGFVNTDTQDPHSAEISGEITTTVVAAN